MSTTAQDATDVLVDPSTPTEDTPTEPTVVDEPETTKDLEPSSESPQPDDEFWLEDGNLTLIAGNVEFRVYKGPLISNSPVFKDMLSLPQPTQPDGATPTQCTCGYAPALVHVSDSPEDLRHLLRALVPGKTPRVVPDEPSYDAISACLRLGHKYEIDAAVQRSLSYLKKYFAESFDSWSRVDPPRPPAFRGVQCIGVVNLARMMNIDMLLPAALMNCSMLEPTELINGYTREDGTTETLSPEDLGRCFLGRTNLMQANTLATLTLFNQTLSEGCTRRDVCAPVFLRLVDELRNHEKVVCTLDWYKYWSDYIDNRDDDRRICAPCYKMLLEREKQQHRDIWKRLPELMGVTVEGWAADPPPVVTEPAPEDAQA